MEQQRLRVQMKFCYFPRRSNERLPPPDDVYNISSSSLLVAVLIPKNIILCVSKLCKYRDDAVIGDDCQVLFVLRNVCNCRADRAECDSSSSSLAKPLEYLRTSVFSDLSNETMSSRPPTKLRTISPASFAFSMQGQIAQAADA